VAISASSTIAASTSFSQHLQQIKRKNETKIAAFEKNNNY